MAERKAYLLRLPAELLDELNRWARDDLRSLNAQIEFVLREAVRTRRRRSIEPGEAGHSSPPKVAPGTEEPASEELS